MPDSRRGATHERDGITCFFGALATKTHPIKPAIMSSNPITSFWEAGIQSQSARDAQMRARVAQYVTPPIKAAFVFLCPTFLTLVNLDLRFTRKKLFRESPCSPLETPATHASSISPCTASLTPIKSTPKPDSAAASSLRTLTHRRTDRVVTNYCKSTLPVRAIRVEKVLQAMLHTKEVIV